MSSVAVLTAFILGMRHGADPDHLAAIDNVTRNSQPTEPRLSRYAGAFFALGHSAMVLAVAVLLSWLSGSIGVHARWIEVVGTWLSIAILAIIAVSNIRALFRNEARPLGAKTRMLPRILREAPSPLMAVPIGLLFGIGFETPSQLAAYGLAFSHGAGVVVGALIGVAFCMGLIATDALDGLLVHHVVSHPASGLPSVARVWLSVVTLFAIAVAAYEIAPSFGLRANEQSDLIFGLSLVAFLLATFAAVFFVSRRRREI